MFTPSMTNEEIEAVAYKDFLEIRGRVEIAKDKFVQRVRCTPPERMKQNLDILDFTLSADDMARIKTLDTDKPFLLGSHEDPEIVKWFMQYKNA